MSESREKFYNIFKKPHTLTSDDLANIHDYITELEQQKAELIEFACNNCIGICYYDECKVHKFKEQ